jgi:hypothetical protein
MVVARKDKLKLAGFSLACAKYSGFQSTHGGFAANGLNLHRHKRFCKSRPFNADAHAGDREKNRRKGGGQYAGESNGCRRLMQGFTARLTAPRPAPHGALRARRGETPLRFSPHPFCGAGAKDKRLYRFFYSRGLRSAAAAELRQPLNSRP